MFKKSLVSPRNRRLASRPLEKFALSGDERNGLVIGGGGIIRPIRGKSGYNLSCYFLESRKEYRKKKYGKATKKISSEVYSD